MSGMIELGVAVLGLIFGAVMYFLGRGRKKADAAIRNEKARKQKDQIVRELEGDTDEAIVDKLINPRDR